MALRLVLAEDHGLLREGIRGLFTTTSDVTLVEACSDLDGLLSAIDRYIPDVVLTDIRMPPRRSDEGIQAARYCRTHHPRMGVVLLSQYANPAYLRGLVAQGAEGRGYLLKDRVSELDDVLDAVRTVAAGGSVIDPQVVETLVRVRAQGGEGELARLSARERQVLGEMARGRSNAAIAASLVITQRAVEKHINAIFTKLGVSHDEELHPRVRAVLLYLAGDPS